MADRLGHQLGFRLERHPADWDTYGKRAGYIRNQQMAELGADILLAFINGHSRGSEMMLDICTKVGIPNRIWRDNLDYKRGRDWEVGA